MLKVCRIVPPRGEDDIDASPIHVIHDFLEHRPIIAVILHSISPECIGTAISAKGTGNQGIGCAGRNPQIVLQDIPNAVLSQNEVDAGNMAINGFRRLDALAFCQISRRTIDEFLRNDSIAKDLLLSVNI